MDDTIHLIAQLFAHLLTEAHGKDALSIAEEQHDKVGQHQFVRATWAQIVERLQLMEDMTKVVNTPERSRMKH